MGTFARSTLEGTGPPHPRRDIRVTTCRIDRAKRHARSCVGLVETSEVSIGFRVVLLLLAVGAAGCGGGGDGAAGPMESTGSVDTTPGAAGEPCNPDAIGVDTPAGASTDGCDLYTVCEGGVCQPIAADPLPCRDVEAVEGLPALWTKLTLASAPPERSSHAAVYDAANDRLIVFGGTRDDDTFLNDTWVLSNATDIDGGATWTELEPTGGPPPARSNPVAAYDAENNRMIIFGGGDGSITRNDTWVLTNANGLGGTPEWTELVAANAPYRGASAAAYDATANTLVVFGGYAGPDRLDELWVLSNANGLDGPASWSRLDAASPPPARAYAPAVFDAAERSMRFYGGDSASSASAQNQILDDTWSLSLASPSEPVFEALNPTVSVGSRANHSLVYDPMTQRAVLFAGVGGDGYGHDDVRILWTGASTTWASYATGNAPPERAAHVAAYSPQANRMVVFGGQIADTRFDDTWVLDRANGESPGAVTQLEVRAEQTSLCAGNKITLTAFATAGGESVVSVPVVWTCSDPAVVSGEGVVSVSEASEADTIECTACEPDDGLCSDPFEIEITAPEPVDGGGGACPSGFFAVTQRTCTVLDLACTCDDFPCNACVPSADFPQAEGHALAEGELGCLDGDTGAIVKPCAPGLCCLVGGDCGNPTGGSYCGECPAQFACP